MKEEEESKTCMVQTFDQLKPEHPKQLDELKQQFQKASGIKEFGEYYIAHPNIKILYSYLFFTFAQENTFRVKKVVEKLKKMASVETQKQLESNKQYQLILQKLRLGHNKSSSWIKFIKQNSNRIVTHKMLLQKFTQNATDDDCLQLVKSASGSSTIMSVICRKKDKKIYQILRKTNLTATILQIDNMAYLVFYEKNQDQKGLINKQGHSVANSSAISSPSSPIKSGIKDEKKFSQMKLQSQPQKSKPSKSQNKSEIKSQISSEQNKQVKKGNEKKNNPELEKVKSQGSKVEEPKKQPAISIQIPWYEVTIILIVIFALLAEFTHFFDDLLHQYNYHMGHYFLLDAGYKLNEILFQPNLEHSL